MTCIEANHVADHRLMTRRELLKQVAVAGAVSSAGTWNGSTATAAPLRSNEKHQVMIPMPSVPWDHARAIGPPNRRLTRAQISKLSISATGFSNAQDSLAAGKRLGPIKARLYNDFCEVQDKSGRWHMMGIEKNPQVAGQPTFYHYVGDRLSGSYKRFPSISSGFALPQGHDQFLNMCAPCVVWENHETALMFYAHVISGVNAAGMEVIYDASIRVLESTDPRLETWIPRNDPEFEELNVVFRESYCRDPEVIWDEDRQIYLMYYVVGEGWSDPESSCVLKVRSSANLKKWSEPTTLMTPPPGHRAVESPFVLKQEGLYYLWISGFDYGRMSLYISEDPFRFGDPVHNRIMEQSGHAPEIVFSNGKYWMACAAVASKVGFPWGWHDLIGTYIQPLAWRPASRVERTKVVRK